jgi:hypothetical protein
LLSGCYRAKVELRWLTAVTGAERQPGATALLSRAKTSTVSNHHQPGMISTVNPLRTGKHHGCYC